MPVKSRFVDDASGVSIQEFLCCLLNCLGSVIVVYHFIKEFGYSSQVVFNDLLPFNKISAAPTNSVFLYVMGCLTAFFSGMIYVRLILTRFCRSKVVLNLESVLSLAIVVALWSQSSKWACLAIFLMHFGILVPVGHYVNGRADAHEPRVKYFDAIFYFLFGMAVVLFFEKYLTPGLLAHWSWYPKIALLTFCTAGFFAAVWDDKIPNWCRGIWDILVVTFIGILVFRIETAYFDYSIFLGPVNEILFGKDILVNALSTYGFFNIYFMAGIFQIFPRHDDYQALSLIVSTFYFLGYSAVYGLIRVFIRNLSLSFVILLTVLNIDFFFSHIPVHWLPQVGFFRFGAYLPVFILLLLLEQFPQKKWLEWVFAVAVGLAMFWVIECGIYIFISIAGIYVCRKFLFNDGGIVWLKRLLRIVAVIVVIGAILTIRIQGKYHAWPQWGDLLHFQRTYAQSGMAMEQFKAIGWWVVPVFIYFSTLYVCFRKNYRFRFCDAWLFMSFMGLLMMLYFVNKQGMDDLARVTIPAFILSAAGLGYWLKENKQFEIKRKTLPLNFLIFLVILISFAVSELSTIKEEKRATFGYFLSRNPKAYMEKKKVPSLALFLKNEESFNKFQFDLSYIRRLTKSDEPLAIFSKIDTLYYLYAPRPSLFNNSFYAHFHRTSEVNRMVRDLINGDAKYLFVDNSPFQCFNNEVSPHGTMALEMVKDYFTKRASLGFLDVYERTPLSGVSEANQ